MKAEYIVGGLMVFSKIILSAVNIHLLFLYAL